MTENGPFLPPIAAVSALTQSFSMKTIPTVGPIQNTPSLKYCLTSRWGKAMLKESF